MLKADWIREYMGGNHPPTYYLPFFSFFAAGFFFAVFFSAPQPFTPHAMRPHPLSGENPTYIKSYFLSLKK
jgi:hypothetical protein